MSIGAISSILGSNAALDNYNTISTGAAGGVSTAASEAKSSSGNDGASSDEPSGAGLSAIVAAVQTFLSDYQSVYGEGAPTEQTPASAGACNLDVAHLDSALRTMSDDFAQFFGPALGTVEQPFGLPLSSTQSLADVQAAMADKSAVQSSGSAGQTAVPVVPAANPAGQAAMAATGIGHVAFANYAAVSIRAPSSGPLSGPWSGAKGST